MYTSTQINHRRMRGDCGRTQSRELVSSVVPHEQWHISAGMKDFLDHLPSHAETSPLYTREIAQLATALFSMLFPVSMDPADV